MLRVPERKSILATATALTASYADVGSAINIEGWTDLTLHCKQTTGSVNALVKAFVFPTGSTPTATTDGYQVVTNTAGTEIEYTTLDGEYAAHPLNNVSGKYIMFQAKNSGGTSGTLTAFLTGNRTLVNGNVVDPLDVSLCAATELTSSYATLQTVAQSIFGYGNLTLHVTESGGTDNALIKVFVGHTGSAPTAITTMDQYTASAGTEIELKCLLSESASLVLPGLTGKWIMVQGKDAGDGSGHATVAVRITGSAVNV